MEREILELLHHGSLAPPQIADRLDREVSEVHSALREMSAKGLLNPPITTQWENDMSTVMTYFQLSDRGHGELIRQRSADAPQ